MTYSNTKTPAVTCLEWRACERGALLGFTKIAIPAWHLEIDGITVYRKNERSWAQLPTRPMLDADRELVRDDDGKPRYAKILWFDDREIADRFSDAIIAAIQRHKAEAATWPT